MIITAVWAVALIESYKNGSLQTLLTAATNMLVSFNSSVFRLLDMYGYMGGCFWSGQLRTLLQTDVNAHCVQRARLPLH